MKKIICFLILFGPLTAHAQNIEISPIPLEPMVHEKKHKQALKTLDKAERQLKKMQKAFKAAEAEKQKCTDLKQELTKSQKALKNELKSANKKIKALQIEIKRLKKPPSTATSSTTAPPRTKTEYPRRSKPITVSSDDFKRVFKLDKNRRPKQYVPVTSNRFEKIKNGQVVLDNATGLMWQQSGSSKYMKYEDAEKYIKQLNRSLFAGYKDWRLPPVDELTSLLTQTRQNGSLYIHPVFDKTQEWCWSSNKRAPAGAWDVSFYYGGVYWPSLDDRNYMRAVRVSQ